MPQAAPKEKTTGVSTMCMGYAKEISAWVCDEARSQRELMMDAWSRAFEESVDESDSSISILPVKFTVASEGLTTG
jgi:hypothetical protein